VVRGLGFCFWITATWAWIFFRDSFRCPEFRWAVVLLLLELRACGAFLDWRKTKTLEPLVTSSDPETISCAGAGKLFISKAEKTKIVSKYLRRLLFNFIL
jgi:hypothetical protein